MLSQVIKSLLLSSAVGTFFFASAQEIPMERISSGHPRLLVGKFGFVDLKRNALSPAGKILKIRILHDAALILGYPLQSREMEGRRLLSASRNVLYRINTLTTAWLLTGEHKYATRAIRELINAANYSDWNPSHYLDVAEMTLAVSIGYDWLYQLLTPSERSLLEYAIIEKGLRPSFQQNWWWISCSNNWNPVCHAGMVAGALTIADIEPALAEEIIQRALENLPRSLKAGYAPNGAYPEGPMYWRYGTEFMAVLLGLLDAVWGEDFGLSAQPGFSVTGDFILATTGPTGQMFNYADCKAQLDISFAMIYLAKKFNRPDWFEAVKHQLLAGVAAKTPKSVISGGNRLLPLALLYLDIPESPKSSPLFYYSGDEALVPIGVLRSDHTSKAAWVGLKAGSPSGPHGHMDGGSFVFESEGYRWAIDLGMEDYTKIEKKRFQLWNSKQDGDRWKLFRLGPISHNILRIDEALQNVKGNAKITKFSTGSIEMDLTTLYTPAAGQVTRTASLLSGRALRLRDRLTGVTPNARITWQMCTQATPEILADGTLKLRHNSQALLIRKNTPENWNIVSAELLRTPVESANPNTWMVSFSVLIPKNGQIELEVTLIPYVSNADDNLYNSQVSD